MRGSRRKDSAEAEGSGHVRVSSGTRFDASEGQPRLDAERSSGYLQSSRDISAALLEGDCDQKNWETFDPGR